MSDDDIHPEDREVHLPPPPERKGWLTEVEIRECWRENMLAAADDCKLLVVFPPSSFLRGQVFDRMRSRLKLAEGACRQMCHWREDARWLYLAPLLEELHQRVRIMITLRQANELFAVCERSLRKLVFDADALENKATGKVGMILPKPLPGPLRETRPVQVIEPDKDAA